jgi:hypothetical protein
MISLIASPPEREARRDLVPPALALWTMLLLLGVILLLVVVALMWGRHRQRMRARMLRPKRERVPLPDAWTEAGRRLEIDDPEEEGKGEAKT